MVDNRYSRYLVEMKSGRVVEVELSGEHFWIVGVPSLFNPHRDFTTACRALKFWFHDEVVCVVGPDGEEVPVTSLVRPEEKIAF